MLKHDDNFVCGAIEPYRFPEGVCVGKERLADGRAQHDDGPCMLLIKSADKAAAFDAKERNCLCILRLSATYDNFLDATIAAHNAVAVPKEEASCAKGRHDLDVGRRLADEIGVVVFKILARSNPFGQTGKISAERES